MTKIRIIGGILLGFCLIGLTLPSSSIAAIPSNLTVYADGYNTNFLAWKKSPANSLTSIFCWTNAITQSSFTNAWNVAFDLPPSVSNYRHVLSMAPKTRPYTNGIRLYYAVVCQTNHLIGMGSYLHFTNTNSWQRLNIWRSNAWQNPRFNATNWGNTHAEFYIRFWSGLSRKGMAFEFEDATNPLKSVSLYAYMTNEPGTNWTRVRIPLSDISPLAFHRFSRFNFQRSASGPISFDVDEMRFVGGTVPRVWYGDSHTNNYVDPNNLPNMTGFKRQTGGIHLSPNFTAVVPGSNATTASISNQARNVGYYPYYVDYSGTWHDFIGVTGNLDQSDWSLGRYYITNVYRGVRWIRDYLSWGQIEDMTNDRYNFIWMNEYGPSRAWPDQHGFYKQAAKHKVNVLPCLMGANNFSSSTPDGNGIPYDNGLGYNPTNYKERSEMIAQIAARYGGYKHTNPADIETADKITGWGFTKYIQDWNEPNGFYDSEGRYTDAKRYAASVHAAHDSTFFPGSRPGMPILGAKSGDPGILHVSASLAGSSALDLDYLLETVTNSFAKQSGRVPFDVLAVNYYTPNKPAIQWISFTNPDASYGVCPEDSTFGFKPQYLRMEKWRNRYLPGIPIWITEFGWDAGIDKGARYYSPVYAYSTSSNGMDTQANYILRGAVLLAHLGAEKAFIFHQADEGSGPYSGAIFASCGIVNSSWSNYKPKPALFYLSTMRELVGAFRFSHLEKVDELIGRHAISSAWFIDPTSQEGAVNMLWCRNPLKDHDTGFYTNNYRVSLKYSPTSCTLVTPTNMSFSGRKQVLTINNPGTPTAWVSVPRISERPVFLKLGNTTIPIIHPNNIKSVAIRPGENKITWDDSTVTIGSYTVYAMTNHAITASNLRFAHMVASNIGLEYKTFYHVLNDFSWARASSSSEFFYAVVWNSNSIQSDFIPGINATSDGILNPIDYPGPYYVAPNGSDQSKGDYSSPLATFAEAIDRMRPTHSVCTTYVRSGVYTQQVIFQRSGSPDKRIQLKNYPGETPEIREWKKLESAVFFGKPYGKDENRDYCWLEGFKITGFSNAVWFETGDNNTIYNCIITNFRGSAVHIEGSTVTNQLTVSNRIVGCQIVGNGTTTIALSLHQNGVPPLRDITYYGNSIRDCDYAAYLNGKVTNLHFVRNEFHSCNQSLLLSGSAYISIVQNLFHHVTGKMLTSWIDADAPLYCRNNMFYSNVPGVSPSFDISGEITGKKIRDHVAIFCSNRSVFGWDSNVTNEYFLAYNNKDNYDNMTAGAGNILNQAPRLLLPRRTGGDFHFKNGWTNGATAPFRNPWIGSAAPDNGVRAARGRYTFWVQPANITNFKRTTYTNVFTTTSIGSVPIGGTIYIQYPPGTFFDSPLVTTTSFWGGGSPSFAATDEGNGLIAIRRVSGNPSLNNQTESLIISGVINPTLDGTNVLCRATYWTTDQYGYPIDFPEQSHDYLVNQGNPATFASLNLDQKAIPTVSGATQNKLKPGCTVHFRTFFESVGNTTASNLLLYDKFPSRMRHSTNSVKVWSTNYSLVSWNTQWSIIPNPDQSFASASYASQVINNLKWIRMRGLTLPSDKSGYFSFGAIVTNLALAGTLYTNITFATARNSRDFNLNPTRTCFTNILTMPTNYGGRFSLIPDSTITKWTDCFWNVSLTNKGNSTADFRLRLFKQFATLNRTNTWAVRMCAIATTNLITNSGPLSAGGNFNFRVRATPLPGTTNLEWIEWAIEGRPNNNYTDTNYLGDDGKLYGGDIGKGLDPGGFPVKRPGAVYQQGNNRVRITLVLPEIDTVIAVRKTITNITLAGLPSTARPGATIWLKLSFTNTGTTTGNKSMLIDYIPTNTTYRTNQSGSATNWIQQWSTNLNPDQSYESPMYSSSITWPKERIRWVRWKKEKVHIYEDGLSIRYSIIIK